jgi:PIN domain nuclease of toxin-antitoxin system
VRLLLDTHAYLWWLADDPGLSAAARSAIAAPESIVHVSAATIWEAEIKAALGRLDTNGADLADEIASNGFVELAITARHAASAGRLPRHHADPFDRMLVAQARSEGLLLVTRDRQVTDYEVDLLPA